MEKKITQRQPSVPIETKRHFISQMMAKSEQCITKRMQNRSENRCGMGRWVEREYAKTGRD